MSTSNRDGTGPAFEKLSFDGHGVNAGDEFATRLLTVARHHPDAGGGYVLDFDGRRRIGTLLAAAPALAAVVKEYANTVEHNPSEGAYRACCGAEWSNIREHMGKGNPHKTDCAAVAALELAGVKCDY